MNSQFEVERKKMTTWAFVVTFLYVAFLLLLAATLVLAGRARELGDLKANEVGDLLAGIGGPFALIWLVYGYFLQGLAIRQQAEELRQNTQALQLQAKALQEQRDEMERSAQHQAKLVEAAFQSMQYEKDRDTNHAMPNLILEIKGFRFEQSVEIDGLRTNGYLVNAEITNLGNVALNVFTYGSPSIPRISPRNTPVIRDKEQFSAQLLITSLDNEALSLGIKYVDSKGTKGLQEFRINPRYSNDQIQRFDAEKILN